MCGETKGYMVRPRVCGDTKGYVVRPRGMW